MRRTKRPLTHPRIFLISFCVAAAQKVVILHKKLPHRIDFHGGGVRILPVAAPHVRRVDVREDGVTHERRTPMGVLHTAKVRYDPAIGRSERVSARHLLWRKSRIR